MSKKLFILIALAILSCKGEESNPDPMSSLIIAQDLYTTNMNESFSFSITLKGDDEVPLVGEEVTLLILSGDVVSSTNTFTTSAQGTAEIRLELKEAYNNSIRLYFSGNDNYHAVVKNIDVIGKYTYRQPESSNGLVSANLLETGVDANLISRMVDSIRRNNTKYQYLNSLLIQQNGELLLEEYFPFEELSVSGTQRSNGTHYVASVSKSITSAMIGIAVELGFIGSIDDKVIDYFPNREIKNLDDAKRSISIRNLLHMQSGLNCSDNQGPTWEGSSSDYIQFQLDLPMSTQPGTNWNYCTGITMILGGIIEEASGVNAQDFANQYLFGPLGMTAQDTEWKTDPSGNTITGYLFWMKARDMIKFGQMFLDKGKWNDVQVVPESWVNESIATGPALTFANRVFYGYQMYVAKHTVNGQIYTAYYAVGNGGNYIINIPELNAVVVFQGAQWNSNSIHTTVEVEFMDQLIIPALLAATD